MALITPSLDDLSQKARGAYASALGLVEAIIWPNTHYVHAKVLALVLHPVYLRIEYLYRQMFASSADEKHLESRHAYERGIIRNRASKATGTIITTGVAGTVYPSGIRYLSGNLLFDTQSEASAEPDGTVTFTVQSLERGASANLAAGTNLNLADPGLFPGLATTADVGPDGLGGGADKEAVNALRGRVLEHKRRPPQGGAEHDYASFARDVTGVSKAWAKAFVNGSTTIGVWFLFDGRPNGIPTAADVAVVEAEIAKRRMIRVGFAVNAPAPVDVPMTIKLSPDDQAVRARVEQAIGAMFAARTRPGLPNDDFVLPVAWISEAISDSVGEDRHTLSAPAADISFASGSYPVPGPITWIAG